MPDRKRVLVTGATGGQGGSVARFLLESGQFDVRCLTRNPSSAKAQQLRSMGAEVVAGDLGDKASLPPAISGCWGVFGVTNFWEHFEGEREHGMNLIHAVAEVGVGHFVFSTLPSYRDRSGGRLPVPHFDIKAELEAESRARRLPATYVHVAYYFENFFAWFAPKRQPDGTYAFGFPQGDTPLAGVAVTDVGGPVRAIFQNADEKRGRTIGIVGDDLPCAQYAAIMGRATGRTVRYNHVDREDYAKLGFPGARELGDMFDFQRQYVPSRAADVELSRRLYPGMQSFETWATANRDKLIAAMDA